MEQAMGATFGKNQKVADTLDAYLQLEKPQFAVLLQGKWGSGKTWFIRNYIDKRKNENQPFCYVSLFGIEQLIEIDSQIIACCNPILSKAEGVSRFAGRIIERLNPAIKGDDIEKFAKFLKKWCKIHGNLVLVLDDLERASIQIELVLGYVSNMLDEVGIKVILLCDPEQFSENKETFLRFKEKVVGNSIAIAPDIETVFDFQVAAQKGSIKRIFEANRTRLLKDFYVSETNNLRHIKRIIYQFSMCYNQMPPEMQTNEAYLSEFLHILFIFSMQIYKGLPREDFSKQKVKIFTRYEFPQHYSSIESVSPSAQWLTSISSEFIEKFFYDGIVDKSVLFNSYEGSEHANAQIIPFVLFNKFRKKELDDADAIDLYNKLKCDISNYKYTEPKIILYAFDMMLKFSQIGIEEKSFDDITRLAQEYISQVIINKEPSEVNEILKHNRFLTRKLPQLDEICKIICSNVDTRYQESINTLMEEIKRLLPENPDEFILRMSRVHSCKGELTHLDAIDFAHRVINVRASRLRSVLENIYRNIYYICNNTPQNLQWCKNFYQYFEENINSIPPIAQNTIRGFMKDFYQLIQEKYQQQDS